MSDRNSRRRRRLYGPLYSSLCLSLAAGAGCTPSKTVTVRTVRLSDAAPLPEATVLVTRVAPEGMTRVTLDPEQSRTPATFKLEFLPDVHYRVEAHRVFCDPSSPVDVTLDPPDQTEFELKLKQFKQNVDGLVYAAAKGGDIWRMAAAPAHTTATIDTAEPDPAYIDQPVAVTDSQAQQQQRPGVAVDFPSFAVAATAGGTVMVYEQSSTDAGIPGGLDSKLYKLPLAANMNPTLLTTNRKQQHNPTFSYSGEDVLFDTDDDSRTRSPVQFKADTNESILTRLDHDADTCETQFSAGRDALAFTSFSPNAPGPEVVVSDLTGAGATSRGRGMEPQLSPDQNRIAFVHRPESGGSLRLATVNVRGPITTQEIDLDPSHDVADPHWSPDGKLIAYCTDLRDGPPADAAREPDVRYREPDNTHSFLWVVRSDGQNPIQLTHGESFDSHPVFDPNDGRTIYFRSNRGGSWNIWKCRLTDAAMTKLGVGR